MKLRDQIINLHIDPQADDIQGRALDSFRRGQGAAVLAAARLAEQADHELAEMKHALKTCETYFMSCGVTPGNDSLSLACQAFADVQRALCVCE